MICATCNKTAKRATVATKTRKVGKHLVIVAKRDALVCDCGVLAWEQPLQPPPLNPNTSLPQGWSEMIGIGKTFDRMGWAGSGAGRVGPDKRSARGPGHPGFGTEKVGS